MLPSGYIIRRGGNTYYGEEFKVEATSREEAKEKIKQAALIFLVKHNLLQVDGFTETTP